VSTRDDDTIICRCEDVTLGDIRRALRNGYTDFEELRRILRCTMGPCQGRTCADLVRREIASFLGVPVEEVPLPTHRPPNTPVPLGALAKAFKERAESGEERDDRD